MTKKTYKICTECGASGSCKEVETKEWEKIKKKFGLYGYNPKKKTFKEQIVKILLECSVEKTPLWTALVARLEDLLAETTKAERERICKEIKEFADSDIVDANGVFINKEQLLKKLK